MTIFKPRWKKELETWERAVLKSGHYYGPKMKGFSYSIGEWVPIDRRYSAFLEWNHCNRVKAMIQTIKERNRK